MTDYYLDQLLTGDKESKDFRRFFLLDTDKEGLLRELARQSVARFKNIAPMNSFEIVGGAKIDYDHWYGLDANRFYDMFTYLLKTGIPIHPDFSVHVSNLLYDEDYLKTDTTADVTLISYVPLLTDKKDQSIFGGAGDDTLIYVDLKRPHAEFLRAREEFANGKSPKSHSFMEANRMVSDLNRVSNWTARLAKSGSKLIFSIYDQLEVDLRVVMPENYIALGNIDSVGRMDETSLGDIKSVHYTTWQAIGANDFVETICYAVRTHITPNSGLQRLDTSNNGTELGTNIVHASDFLLEQAMMKAMREEAAKRPKTYPQPLPPKKPD